MAPGGLKSGENRRNAAEFEAVMSLPKELDWGAQWFAAVAPSGMTACQRVAAGASLPQALNDQTSPRLLAGVSHPLRFVPQCELPQGIAYESHIFATGCVPTRDNLHDFFNGLIWLRFPCAKQKLNQLQGAEIAAAGVGSVRGRVRDALTLFDENAALLQAPEPLWQALLARDWQLLFLTLRPLWSQARLVLFGHALLEKLVQPYKSITAHVYRQRVPQALGSDLDDWDRWLANCLNRDELAIKPFTPLPVLGVPGWWADNALPAFYDDTAVFRPPRLSATAAFSASP